VRGQGSNIFQKIGSEMTVKLSALGAGRYRLGLNPANGILPFTSLLYRIQDPSEIHINFQVSVMVICTDH
jgi:hypothetical protein